MAATSVVVTPHASRKIHVLIRLVRLPLLTMNAQDVGVVLEYRALVPILVQAGHNVTAPSYYLQYLRAAAEERHPLNPLLLAPSPRLPIGFSFLLLETLLCPGFV